MDQLSAMDRSAAPAGLEDTQKLGLLKPDDMDEPIRSNRTNDAEPVDFANALALQDAKDDP